MTSILRSVVIVPLLLGSALRPLPGDRQCLVRGRIEILNPKVRLRDGRADSGGVVIWLVPLKGVSKPELRSLPRRRIEQRDKRFFPHVTVIQVGTEVDFPNHDPFFHNVYSVYDGKPFDLGLYANGESRPVLFDRQGISYIFCNIGKYQMHVWHERSDERQLSAQSRAVSVESAVADLGVTRLDEAGYIPRTHADRNGADAGGERH